MTKVYVELDMDESCDDAKDLEEVLSLGLDDYGYWHTSVRVLDASVAIEKLDEKEEEK